MHIIKNNLSLHIKWQKKSFVLCFYTFPILFLSMFLKRHIMQTYELYKKPNSTPFNYASAGSKSEN